MKKRTAKALRLLADRLPPAYKQRSHTERGRLADFHEYVSTSGKEIPDLSPLTEENADTIIGVKFPNLEVLNHHRRLKKAYTENGEKGIQDYILWLTGHNKRWAAKIGEVEQVDAGLLAIAKGKVSGFWSALVSFLFAFASVFGVKEKT